jgi:1,4-alpha-glucan branching enzyme
MNPIGEPSIFIDKATAPVSAPRAAAPGQAVRRAVRFGLELFGARKVSVVGTFNQWNPEAMPLRCVGGSKWFRYVPLDTGRHEYRFVVDGKWMDDPKAREFIPNPQGGQNAVLQIVDRRYES